MASIPADIGLLLQLHIPGHPFENLFRADRIQTGVVSVCVANAAETGATGHFPGQDPSGLPSTVTAPPVSGTEKTEDRYVCGAENMHGS